MATPQQRAWNQRTDLNNLGARRQGWKAPKLTTAQRDAIVRRLSAGEKSADLAAEYGVSGSTIRRLRQYMRPA
jgi:DNA-binding NarL/FixJ family response regulator